MYKYIILIILNVIGFTESTGQELKDSFFKSKDSSQELYLGDSTFIFKYKFGMWRSACSKGTWAIEQGQLILDSDFTSSTNLPVRVTKSHNQNIDGIVINVKIDTTSECSFAEKYKFNLVLDCQDTIRGKQNMVVKKKHSSFFVQVFVDSVTYLPVPFINMLETESYSLNDSDYNQYDVYIPLGIYSFNYMPLTKERLKIKRKRLIWNSDTVLRQLFSNSNILIRGSFEKANLINLDECDCDLLLD